MEPEIKPRKLRIVTGSVPVLEAQLNVLVNDYTAIVWAFAPVGAEMHGTVVLLHSSVMMQRALAQPGPIVRN